MKCTGKYEPSRKSKRAFEKSIKKDEHEIWWGRTVQLYCCNWCECHWREDGTPCNIHGNIIE